MGFLGVALLLVLRGDVCGAGQTGGVGGVGDGSGAGLALALLAEMDANRFNANGHCMRIGVDQMGGAEGQSHMAGPEDQLPRCPIPLSFRKKFLLWARISRTSEPCGMAGGLHKARAINACR